MHTHNACTLWTSISKGWVTPHLILLLVILLLLTARHRRRCALGSLVVTVSPTGRLITVLTYDDASCVLAEEEVASVTSDGNAGDAGDDDDGLRRYLLRISQSAGGGFGDDGEEAVSSLKDNLPPWRYLWRGSSSSSSLKERPEGVLRKVAVSAESFPKNGWANLGFGDVRLA